MTGTEEDMTTEDGDCSRLLYSSKKSACQAAYALHKASPTPSPGRDGRSGALMSARF